MGLLSDMERDEPPMICFIESAEKPAAGIIERIRRTRRGYCGFTARNIVVLGFRAHLVQVDRHPAIKLKTVQKRISRAAEWMRAAHVTQIQFSKNFPYRELVLREGFDEIDESLLTESLAGMIASRFSGKDKAAAFFARHLTGNAERAFNDMCRDFRYVMAAVESDSAQLFNAYGRRFGISVIGQPTENQLQKADVAVFFDPPSEKTILPENCIVIPVSAKALDGVICGKTVCGLTVELTGGRALEIPDGFKHEPIVAHALRTGTLRRDEILLKHISIAEMHIRPVNDLTKF